MPHAPQHGAYFLTSAVRALASGYHSEPMVVEAAAPLMNAMTLRITWPMAVAMLEDARMVLSIPLAPGTWHAPPADATIARYLATLDAHGVRCGVLAAASLLGTNNVRTEMRVVVAALAVERFQRDPSAVCAHAGGEYRVVEVVVRRTHGAAEIHQVPEVDGECPQRVAQGKQLGRVHGRAPGHCR